MGLVDEIEAVANGAKFIRADLHIHSYGKDASYDVDDNQMTPENIVNTAIAERLSVISITDHNKIGNVERAIEHGANLAILVLPGVELSTPQGHFLAYLPTYDALKRFYGKLDFSSDYRACEQTMHQCLELVGQYGGVGVAAHIEIEAGIAGGSNKFDHAMESVICSEHLLALEIKGISAESWFTERDDNPDRKRLIRLRRERLSEPDTADLAKLLSSDSHKLSALGRNAQLDKKVTRLKMDSLSFDSFVVAIRDPEARVRIEELIPESIPFFQGLKVSGGFLDGQVIHFNPNLNCIIGGRGTGKSTLLETLRCTSGNETRDDGLVDCEAWPDRARLLYRDEAGTPHEFSRSKGQWVVNETDPEDGITQIPIESYGQGQTANTAKDCESNPDGLLKFLDQFVIIDDLKREDDELRKALMENETEIEMLQVAVSTIPEIRRLKIHNEKQLEALKKKKAEKVIDFESKLATGRLFREELEEEIDKQFGTLEEAFSERPLSDFLTSTNPDSLVVGKEKFSEVSTLVTDYEQAIVTLGEALLARGKQVKTSVLSKLSEWKTEEARMQVKIDEVREELKGEGINLDMPFIRLTTENVARYARSLKELEAKRKQLKGLEVDRKTILENRDKVGKKIFTERSRFAIGVTRSLKSTVVDYSITVTFEEGRLSPDFEDLLKNAMGWRTARVPKAALIASKLSPRDLRDAVRQKDTSTLEALDISKQEAASIIETMGKRDQLNRLEACRSYDRPRILVSRPSAAGRPLAHDFDRLSMGQQQSVILSIMLFSNSNHPLIVDQPEDNLDSEFVFKTFVSTLRTVKEKRQVIVVTHNANIAVLGDAELIIPLRATSEKSIIRNPGAIDSPETKALACTILEGSEQAFRRRQSIYGL